MWKYLLNPRLFSELDCTWSLNTGTNLGGKKPARLPLPLEPQLQVFLVRTESDLRENLGQIFGGLISSFRCSRYAVVRINGLCLRDRWIKSGPRNSRYAYIYVFGERSFSPGACTPVCSFVITSPHVA